MLASGDWLQRRKLASVLLAYALDFRPTNTRSSKDSERDLTSAMRWFGEAITHNNEDVEALWGFGTAATRLDKDLDLAESALLAAYKRAPKSADIAMSLANLKARQQKPEEMIPFLKDTIRYSTNHSVSKWAGLKHSSPNVCTRYVVMSHVGSALFPAATPAPIHPAFASASAWMYVLPR
jgi:hypothetical protein